MKKFIALLSATAMSCSILSGFPAGTFDMFDVNAADGVAINAANFPDEMFRSYVSNYTDSNADGVLSPTEIADVAEIDVSYMAIENLKGIEHFSALVNLICQSNNLNSLDVSKNTKLEMLYCNDNNLTSLDLRDNTELDFLCCRENKLESLDLSQNTAITYLECADNQLTTLDISNNKALQILDCSDNKLTSLNANYNTSLMDLKCNNNKITSLNVSNSPMLLNLECSNNQLTSIDLNNNTYLSDISCSSNTYHIGAVGAKYYLNVLPGNINPAKTSNWKGASYSNGVLTNITGISGTKKITYNYNAGNGNTLGFTLTYTDAAEVPLGEFSSGVEIQEAPDNTYICDDTSPFVDINATFEYDNQKYYIDIADYSYVSNTTVKPLLDMQTIGKGDKYLSAFDIYWQAYNAGSPSYIYKIEYTFDISYVNQFFCKLTAATGLDITYDEWSSFYTYQLYEDGEGVVLGNKPITCKIAQKGDATLDHTIDAKDAAAIAKYIAQATISSNATINSTDNELGIFAADTNGDGTIDAKDAANVAKFSSQKALYPNDAPDAQSYYEIWNNILN